MPFKLIRHKQCPIRPEKTLFNREHHPSWVRFGGGHATVDLSAHAGRKWLSIDTTEARDDGKASKRTMVTLDEDAVRELRDLCNQVLGE